MNTTLDRKSKLSKYIKTLKDGDKVQFCGLYGGCNTFYYHGKLPKSRIPLFSERLLGLGLPRAKWKQRILLPEEWGEEIYVENDHSRNKRLDI